MSGNFLVFDLDGTLSDPREGIINAFNFALRTLGGPEQPGEALLRFIGPSLRYAFGELLDTDDADLISGGIALFRRYYRSGGYRENRLYPGIREMLVRLKAQGDHLYVLTTKIEVTARKVVEYFGLSPLFERVYGSTRERTKVVVLREILKTKDLDENRGRERAWMIGDRLSDIEAGKEAGVRTMGVAWGFGAPSELKEAEICVESPAELFQFFKLLGRKNPGRGGTGGLDGSVSQENTG